MSNMLAEFWIPRIEELRWFTPELILVATIAAVLIVPLIAGRSASLVSGVALIGVVATLVATGRIGQALLTRVEGGVSGMSPPGAAPMLLVDNFAVFFKLFLMLFLSLVTTLWMIGRATPRPAAFPAEPAHAPEFFVLLLSSALGMVLMVSTLNLLMIVLAIELASLPSYAIAGFSKSNRRSAEASLKYVIFGAATAAIMLYGVSLLYGYFGTLDLAVIAGRASERLGTSTAGSLTLGVGLFALFVGIGFKIAVVPFHFWCPDVFEGAPVEVTTWLSVASKAAGLGLFLRILSTLVAPTAPQALQELWGPLAVGVGVFAALTCTVANFAAYRQENVKRILAYSSIAHAGYMLMVGAILAPAGGSIVSSPVFSPLIVYVFLYLFMNLGAFGVTAMVSWQSGSEDLSAFNDLGRRAPWLAVPMAVCLFSLVGLPPLGGFIAKWWVLYALGNGAGTQPWLMALIVVLVLNTLFSLYFYLRIVLRMFLRTGVAGETRPPRIEAPLGGLVLVNVCAIILLYAGTLGVMPMKNAADAYASHLFVGANAGRTLEPVSASAADAKEPVRP